MLHLCKKQNCDAFVNCCVVMRVDLRERGFQGLADLQTLLKQWVAVVIHHHLGIPKNVT